jgi:glucose/arabinose dehydrogenase
LTRFFPPANDDRALRVGMGGDPFEVDRSGHVYSVNSLQNRFTQILITSSDGEIRVLAGGAWGFADGLGNRARFGDLHSGSFLVAPDGSLLVSDDGLRVRRVAPDGNVSTLAGGAESRHVDGPRATARFVAARGLAFDAEGSLLIADAGGERIRRIAPGGTVSTFAGSGVSGSADGPAADASFSGPTGLAVGPWGELFVWEPEPGRVRKIADGRVSTVLRELP